MPEYYKHYSKDKPIVRDYHPTPDIAIDYIWEHVKQYFVGTVFEPCCGDGAVVKYLGGKGIACDHMDLYPFD